MPAEATQKLQKLQESTPVQHLEKREVGNILASLFDLMDANHDGQLKRLELMKALTKRSAEVESLVSSINQNEHPKIGILLQPRKSWQLFTATQSRLL